MSEQTKDQMRWMAEQEARTGISADTAFALEVSAYALWTLPWWRFRKRRRAKRLREAALRA